MILFPAILDGYSTRKDKTLKVVFETNELTPDQAAGIASNLQQFGYLAFKNEPFSTNEKELMNNLKTDFEDKSKTPSMRQRAVLYRIWELNKDGFDTFARYYDHRMEKIITHFKKELDSL